MKKILTGFVLIFLAGCQMSEMSDIPLLTEDISVEKAADIVFVSPESGATDIKGKVPLNFLWKESVFSLQNNQQSKKFLEKNITLTPDHEGEWRVLGTTGISFEPKKDWKLSTKYSLEISRDLVPEFDYSFETKRVSIESVDANNLVNKEPLKIFLNQEVDLREISLKTKVLDAENKEILFNLWYGKVDGEIVKDRLELIPNQSWIESGKYKLIIEEGIFSAEGNLPIEKKYLKNFTAAAPFSIKKFEIPDYDNESVRIRFSTPVSSKNFAKFIETTPSLSPESWQEYTRNWVENDYDSAYFYLNPPEGSWDPREKFTITIKEGLMDIYERKLERVEKSFQTDLRTQFSPIYMPKSNSTFAQDTEIVTSFIYGGNVESVNVSFNGERRVFDLDSSLEKKQVWKMDLKETFPSMIDESGESRSGKYTLKIEANIPGEDWKTKYESQFFISDFSVELKKLANKRYQVFAHAYPGDANLAENFDLEVFVSNWNTERSYQVFKNVSNGFEFDIKGTELDLKTVEVRIDDKVGYGSIYFNEGMSPWDSNVEFGVGDYDQRFSGALLTDRPLYKPGQKLFFKGFLRERQLFGKNFPLKNVEENGYNRTYKVRVYDPSYQEISVLEGVMEKGSFDGEFEIPGSAKLGNYRLKFELNYGEFEMSAPFWIQEYRKPNFLISTDFDAERAILQDTVTAKINAQYAFGGAITNRPINYTVSLFGYEPCRFWCWSKTKKDKVLTSGEGVLNKNGEFEIPITLKDIDLGDINWELLTINSTIQVSEAERSSIEKSIPFFVANRSLEVKNAPYFFQAGNPAKISGEIRNLDDKLLADENISMTLFKTKWVRSDRKNADGNFYGEWESLDEEIWEKEVTSDLNGQFVFDFESPESGGEYFFLFAAKDEKDRSITHTSNFWIAGNNLQRVRKNETNKILWLFPDKDEYQVGEFAEIFVPNPEFEVTRVHATIERGEVLEELIFNSKTNTIKFEIEKWMTPNIYVSVLVEGKDENGNFRVKWGSHKIQVKDVSHELKISVNPAKKIYRPGEEAELKITTTVNGEKKAAEVSIAVVDQTLLALKSRVKIDLMQSLIGELSLGVETFHTLANFMSKAEMEDVLEEADMLMAKMELGFGGGGGGEKGDDFKPRGDFRDTAEFFAKIQTDENGEATVKFKLPDNLTTWNVFTVGATDDNAFGTNEENFQVTLPLLISEIVPNFFQAGDSINVGLSIHREDGGIEEEEITVQLNLPAELEAINDLEQTIMIGKEGIIYFPIKVKNINVEKDIEIGFTILAEKSDISDAVILKRKILPQMMSLSAAEFLRVENPAIFSLLPDSNSVKSVLKVKVFASLANYLENLVTLSQKNDYGSTEQRFSRATGMMYQAQLDEFLGRNIENLNRTQIKEDLDYIEKSFELGGGFKYWNESDLTSFWVTTQVLEHAKLWQKFDLAIDQQKIKKSADWLKKEVLKVCEKNNWQCPHDISRMNAAYALTKYDKISVNDLDFLNKFTSSLEAKVWWVRTAQNVGELPPKIREIYNNHLQFIKQNFVIRDRYGFWSESVRSFYSQDERLTAITLSTLMESDIWAEQYHKISQYLAESKKEFLSGNSAMQILKTLAEYIEAQETESVGAEFEVENITRSEVLLKGSLKNLSQVQEYTQENIAKEKQTISVTSTAPVLAEIELQDMLPSKFIEENSRGFWIEREVLAIDGKNVSEKPVENLELGKNYLVKLKVITNTSHRQVLVEDPIPSGTEIVNFDLDNSEKTLSKMIDGEQKCFWGWCQPLFQHKEYRYDRARFFIDYLSAGTYEINYILQTRLSGEFEWLPAQVKEMYYPEVFANTSGQNIIIE